MGFVLRIVACVFAKEVYACIVGRRHESACYGGIFGPSVGRQRKKQKNAICCGALLGAEKSSLPLGEGNAAFFWASFSAYFKLLTEANLPGTAALLDPSLDGLDFSWGFVVRSWGPKNRPCLWEKETQRFLGLRFARRGC